MSNTIPGEPCINETYWNEENNKDDTGTAEQVVFLIILVYIFWLGKQVHKNIKDLLAIRGTIKIAKRMRVNVLIGIFLAANVFLYVDGPIGLIVPNGYLSLRFYYVLQYTCLTLMELCFLAAAYNWASPIAHLYQFNKDRMKLLRKTVSFIMTMLLIISITMSNIIMIFSEDFCYLITYYSNGLQLWDGIILLTAWATNMIVVTLCFLLAKKITNLYEFKSNKKAVWIRSLAYLTAFGLTFRIIKDGFQIFGIQLFSILILNGDSYGSSNLDQLPWCFVEFLFLMLCGFVPVTFLTIINDVSHAQKNDAKDPNIKDIKLTLIKNETSTTANDDNTRTATS